MSSEQIIEENQSTKKESETQNNKQKNYIPIIIDDKSIKDYLQLSKQYQHTKKQHTLRIKVIKKNYKKDVLHLKNKYKMYYNIVNNDYNKSLDSIKDKLKLVNYHNVFYKQITNYMDMLYKKYDINIIFRAFYFSFLFDIYIMVQDDKHIINLNKLSEIEQKQFINRTIQHLLQFYNGFIPKKEYKFYPVEFTIKHFNEDPNFEDESFNEYKNNPEFTIFYNICYNLYFIRREIVLDYIDLDKIFERYYTEMKQYFNKKYFKNNFWILNLRKSCEEYVVEIRQIYREKFNYDYPFEGIDVIYIFGDVLYQPPKDCFYGFDNDFKLTYYFEEFLKQIPYNDFYFRDVRYNFDNENYSSNTDEEEDDDEEDEEDEDE